MRPFEFLSLYRGPVIAACRGTGMFPSIKMAQAILETGYGKSIKHNNMFGIKAKGKFSPYWKGLKILCLTHELVKGVLMPKNLYFRDYVSITDSIRDHTFFLIDNPRYKVALMATDFRAQAFELEKAGYATSKGYASELIKIVLQYNLTSLDDTLSVIVTPPTKQ
jgi:flagellum-specific peptidoglycan hydrolase FlgJ